MKIRTLFSIFTVSIIILMSITGFWQLMDGRTKVQAVSWLVKANKLVSSIHIASGELAVERGLTSSILSQATTEPISSQTWFLLKTQQNMADNHLSSVEILLEQLIAITASDDLISYQKQLHSQLGILIKHRQQVTNAINGLSTEITAQYWFTEVTRIIEVLHDIASISILPIEDNIYSYASLSIVQDVLFTLSEYLGRQRAYLASVLVEGKFLSSQELEIIAGYKSISEESYQRFLVFIEHLPEGQKSNQELENLEGKMHDFNILRDLILSQSQNNKNYSVSSEEWFKLASDTIQSVQKNSNKLSIHHEIRVGLLHKNAKQSQWITTIVFAFFIIGFGVATHVLRKRVLIPLERLRYVAGEITLHNLDCSFQHYYEDEVGILGQAFEDMRLQLVKDKGLRQIHEQERKKLYTAIEQSIVAIVITDQHGNVEYINQPYMQATGHTADIIGQKMDIWRLEAKSISQYQELRNNLSSGKSWSGELLNKRKNGGLYWALTSISPVFNELGEITHYIDIHLDISENKRVAQRLNFISYYDQTTSLPNRQYLSRRFEKVKKEDNTDTFIALTSLTIGKLKQINDSMGWQVGDQVLREVGDRLKNQVEINDVVAHQEGGKFIVLFLSISNESELRVLINEIIKVLSQPVIVQHQRVQLNPKAGVSIYSHSCNSFDNFLKQSNIALHNAEKSKVNTICLFHNEMDISVKQKMLMEGALSSAIKNNELELYYQPKVNIHTGTVDSVEALLRWYDKSNNKFISPDIFIPIAEGNGLIFILGDWVLEQACQQLLRWNKDQQLSLTVAVNLSVEQLKQTDFLIKVQTILEKTGVPAEKIELELTESVLMENPEQTMDLLIALKKMGFKLSIDDFGTGYSSLSYLSRLPVDYLKIDRSFIEHITSDINASAIAISIIALGHRMGLKIIAEGVETAEQLEYLHQNNCDYMQGFYYSRPLPADQLADLLKNRNILPRSIGKPIEKPSH